MIEHNLKDRAQFEKEKQEDQAMFLIGGLNSSAWFSCFFFILVLRPTEGKSISIFFFFNTCKVINKLFFSQ